MKGGNQTLAKTVTLEFDEALLLPEAEDVVRPVYTLPLHEMRLAEFCRRNGIHCYLPLRRELRYMTRTCGDRTYEYRKEVMRPMFPSYVFARMSPEQRSQIFRSGSVLRILENDTVGRDQFLNEIRAIRQIEKIGLEQELDFNGEICEGDKFLIESGPWQGIYGYLLKKDKQFVWTVEIECIGGLVQAKMDPTQYRMSRAE